MLFFRIVLFIVFFFVKNVITFNNEIEVLNFYANIIETVNFNISECTSEKPYYYHSNGQNITVNVYVNSPYTVSDLMWCSLGDEPFSPNSTLTLLESNIQHVKIDLVNIRSIDDVSNFICRLLLTSRDLKEIRCEARLWKSGGIGDHAKVDNAKFLKYVDASMAVDEIKPFVMKDLYFSDFSSLLLRCKKADKNYSHSFIRKYENGNYIFLTKKHVLYYFSLRKTSDVRIYSCLKKHKMKRKVTYEAALRLTYLDMDITADETSTHPIRGIISISMGLIVIIAIVVVSVFVIICRRRKESGKRQKREHEYETRPGTPESIYEQVYDVPYEDRIARERYIQNVFKEANQPKRPPPPPVETIPMKEIPANTGTFRSAADEYLLKIDSEGYEIPPQFLLQINQDA